MLVISGVLLTQINCASARFAFFYEQFSVFSPIGWTRDPVPTILSPYYLGWSFNRPSYSTLFNHTKTFAVVESKGYHLKLDAMLITPIIDCTGKTDVELIFNSAITIKDWEFAQVRLITNEKDGGVNKTTMVWICDRNHINECQTPEVHLNLSRYQVEDKFIQLRFFYGNATNAFYWGITDVRLVEGSPLIFAPDAPKPPFLLSERSTSLQIGWNTMNQDSFPSSGSDDISSYQLDMFDVALGNWTVVCKTVALGCSILQLTPYTEYKFRLRAINYEPLAGPWSENTTFTTAKLPIADIGRKGFSMNLLDRVVSIPFHNLFKVQASGFTIELWVWPTTLSFFTGIFTLKETDRGVSILTNPTLNQTAQIVGAVQTSPTGANLFIITSKDAKIRTRRWQHVALVYSPDPAIGNFGIQLYVNGEIVPSNRTIIDQQQSFEYFSPSITIGREFQFDDTLFNGKVDDIRIWSTNRTQDQIQQHMNELVSPTEPNLVANWRSSDEQPTTLTVVDQTGRTNNGTFQGTGLNPDTVWEMSTAPLFGICEQSGFWGDNMTIYLAGEAFDGDGLDVYLSSLPAVGRLRLISGEPLTINTPVVPSEWPRRVIFEAYDNSSTPHSFFTTFGFYVRRVDGDLSIRSKTVQLNISLIPMCFGIRAIDAAVCSGHGECVSNDQCSCDGGWTGDNCELVSPIDFSRCQVFGNGLSIGEAGKFSEIFITVVDQSGKYVSFLDSSSFNVSFSVDDGYQYQQPPETAQKSLVNTLFTNLGNGTYLIKFSITTARPDWLVSVYLQETLLGKWNITIFPTSIDISSSGAYVSFTVASTSKPVTFSIIAMDAYQNMRAGDQDPFFVKLEFRNQFGTLIKQLNSTNGSISIVNLLTGEYKVVFQVTDPGVYTLFVKYGATDSGIPLPINGQPGDNGIVIEFRKEFFEFIVASVVGISVLVTLLFLLLLVLVIIVVTIFVLWRQRRKQSHCHTGHATEPEKVELSTMSATTSPHLVVAAAEALDRKSSSSSTQSGTDLRPSLYMDVTSMEILFSDLTMIEKLGVGAYGEVWKAKWAGNHVVAVKMFSLTKMPEGTTQEQVFRDFENEICLLGSMRHNNILMFMGWASAPNCTYALVTEYADKGSLYELLYVYHHEFVWRQKLSIMIDVAKGMDYLHRKQIVHRDLKSANILLCTDLFTAKVADFGLSKIKKNLVCSTEPANLCVGTPMWIAPEVAAGGEYGEMSDVYSYSICMFELLAEELPFQNEPDQNLIHLRVAHDPKFRPPFPELQCDTKTRQSQEKYCALMAQAWSHDPAQRPKFRDIIERLQALHRGRASKGS